MPHTPDYNAEDQNGTHVTQATIKDGVRVSAYNAYIEPVLGRKNLTIVSDCFVEKINFDGLRATGVQCSTSRGTQTFYASREVVLSAGTVASPQLLMVSGIGPSEHLSEHDIEVVSHLPGVGENLQDHVVAPLRYRCDKPVSAKSQLGLVGRAKLGVEWMLFKKGLGASNFFEVGAFFDSDTGSDYLNMQHEFLPFLADFQDGKVVLGDGFQYFVSQMRPYSRGSVRLRSANPRDHPRIVFNYLADTRDVDEMVAGIKMTRDMANQSSWDQFRDGSLDEDLDGATDSDMTSWLRKNANTEHHPVGTCRMGTDDMAVTDGQGCVYGVDGLRVVDGAILPTVPTANIQAPIMMIAERISDDIIRTLQI